MPLFRTLSQLLKEQSINLVFFLPICGKKVPNVTIEEMNEPETIERILDECVTIAVIGLSSDPGRPSNRVAAFMQKTGCRVIPVNPHETEVLGEKAYGNLSEVREEVDLVNVFRRSDKAGDAVDDAIAAGVKAVWMQEGVIDQSAAERAEDAGLLVVMDRCWLVERYRYGD